MTMPATTFDSTREALSDLMSSIKSGKTQLPDFQRGWVWDDEHIRSLLASVSLSFPVGAVMMLQTGNANVRFKPRVVEGAPSTSIEPERLILDGQQRLTSLFQALSSGQAVATRDARKKAIRRWYYVHIPTALDQHADRDDAIVGIPEDRVVRSFRGEIEHDYSTIEHECAAELLPLAIVFDVARLTDWQMKYLQADPSKMQERLQRWNELVASVIQPFQQYQVPLILLRKETPKEAVCQVFEKVNTGGVSLTVFELLTATFATDGFNMRDDWAARIKRLHRHRVLEIVENTDVLQAVTLLTTYERRRQAIKAGTAHGDGPAVSCKRKDVLALTLEDFRRWIEPVTAGFEQAAKFLMAQKFYGAWDVPYRSQLVPMAAAFAALGSDGETEGAKTKLARWYWCGVFGELYGGAIETRFAKDLVDLVDWIRGGTLEPSTVAEANFAPSRLRTLRTRNSAAYKGLAALLLRDGGRDLRTGDAADLQTYFDERIDIHHIFPKKWCIERMLDRRLYDCIVNKTPLAAKTNRIIGGKAPSDYLKSMETRAGISSDQMNGILTTHVIEPALLRADDFAAFFSAREKQLLLRIERAIGKATVVTAAAEAEDPTDELEDEDDTDNCEN